MNQVDSQNFRTSSRNLDQSPPEPQAGEKASAAEVVMFDVLERAIDRRQQDRDEAAWIREHVEGSPVLEKWAILAREAADMADQCLVRAILATNPELDATEAGRWPQLDHWPSRGAKFRGTVYLAVRDPSRPEDDPGGDSRDLMALATVEADAIIDLDARMPRPAQPPVNPRALLPERERAFLDTFDRIGHQEASHRLFIGGPYQKIFEVIERLGTDAVAELRRLIEAGKLA